MTSSWGRPGRRRARRDDARGHRRLNLLGGQMAPAVTTVILAVLAGTLAELRSNRSTTPES